jgi:hypothetical protein
VTVDEEVSISVRLCQQPASEGEELRNVLPLWRNHVRVVFIDDVVKAKFEFGVLTESAKRVWHWPVWIKDREDVTAPGFAVAVQLVDTADADPERGE